MSFLRGWEWETVVFSNPVNPNSFIFNNVLLSCFLSCFITGKEQLGVLSIFYPIISFVRLSGSFGIFPIILLPQVSILPNYLSTPQYQGPSFIQLLITFSFLPFKSHWEPPQGPSGFCWHSHAGPLSFHKKSLQGSSFFFLPPSPKPMPHATIFFFFFWYGTIPYPGPQIYYDYLLLCQESPQSFVTYNSNRHFIISQNVGRSEIGRGEAVVLAQGP